MTITLHQVSKTHDSRGRSFDVLRSASATLPAALRIAVLATSPVERTAFARLLSGISEPDSGWIERRGSISFPLGASLGLQPYQSVRRNLAYAARLYGLVPAELIRYVATIAQVRPYLASKVKFLAPRIVTRLRFALAYALPFDMMIADGSPMPRGDDQPLLGSFDGLLRGRGFILVTSNPRLAREYCEAAMILHEGKLQPCQSLQHGLAVFSSLMQSLGDQSTPQDDDILSRGRHAIRLGRIEEANAIVDVELTADPDNAVALYLMAEIEIAMGDLGAGIDLLTQVVTIRPDMRQPWQTLVQLTRADLDPNLLRIVASALRKHAEASLRRLSAKTYQRLGDMELALATWHDVIEVAGDNPSWRMEAAEFELRFGSAEHCIGLVEPLLTQEEPSWRVLFLKARAESALARYEDLANTVLALTRLKPVVGGRFVRTLLGAGLVERARAVQALIAASASPGGVDDGDVSDVSEGDVVVDEERQPSDDEVRVAPPRRRRSLRGERR